MQFDEKGEQGTEGEVEMQKLSDEQLSEMWMRSASPTRRPTFLRRRFLMESAAEEPPMSVLPSAALLPPARDATLQDPAPIARVRLEPSDTVTVGQPLSIVVEVLVPSFFMGAPRFPDLEIADALVVFEDRGANFTERVSGQTFAGQSRRYNVYPQRPGAFEVPEIPVAVRFFSGGPTDDVVSPSPVRFRAEVPPGTEGMDPFIATTRLTLEEVYEPEPIELSVGDAFTRRMDDHRRRGTRNGRSADRVRSSSGDRGLSGASGGDGPRRRARQPDRRAPRRASELRGGVAGELSAPADRARLVGTSKTNVA